MMMTKNLTTSSPSPSKLWIRGVNLGGWLVMERYIAPYQFAITDCHIAGDFCWYPGAVSAPPVDHPAYRECPGHGNNSDQQNEKQCTPYRPPGLFGNSDYPLDEWHLALAFANNTRIGEEWFNYHFDNFLRKEDLIRAKGSGLTHVRVPLPHWILGKEHYQDENAPWIVGDRWKYFVRLCMWAREIGLQVWPNIHTAPGSQNGFDNSGLEKQTFTCDGWSNHTNNVQRSLDVIDKVSAQFVQDGLTDVVTGFGLLNEPFGDCDRALYKRFLDRGFAIVRENMGPDVAIYVSDMFTSEMFNDGEWWLDATHSNTFLDSHFYQVFSSAERLYSTKEHIHHICYPESPQNAIQTCCYEDAPQNTRLSSQGVQRISTEWSAAFDIMPGNLIVQVMNGIDEYGVASGFDRNLSLARQEFMRNFVQAQMVAYEQAAAAPDVGVSRGWFFWTLKTEGGAFAEWDFLRGLTEGWIPTIVDPDIASQEVYGSCLDILERTENRTDIISDGYSMYQQAVAAAGPVQANGLKGEDVNRIEPGDAGYNWIRDISVIGLTVIALLSIGRRSHRSQYHKIADVPTGNSIVNV